jgi:hypothetical protein
VLRYFGCPFLGPDGDPGRSRVGDNSFRSGDAAARRLKN